MSKHAPSKQRVVTIEPDWPEFGKLPDGQRVRLADVEDTIPQEQWPNVEIELPSGMRSRPWRHVYDV